MTRMLRLPTLVTTAVVLAACLPAAAAPDAQNEQRTLKRIETAWRARLKKAGSARLKFRKRGEVAKILFYHRLQTQAGGESIAARQEKLAREYFPTRQSGSLSIDGLRMRVETRGRRPAIRGRMIDWHDTKCSNGETSRSLAMHTGTTDGPVGYIHRDARCRAALGVDLKPVCWTFAPLLSEVSGLKLSGAVVESTSATLKETRCVLLKQTRHGGRVVREYWLDPDRDYSVLRMMLFCDGEPRVQLDCRWTRHAVGVWLPKKWEYSFFGGPGFPPRSAAEVEVTDYTLNPEFEAEEFELPFPAGTVAQDFRPRQAREVSRRGSIPGWVVLRDGSRRPIGWQDELPGDEKRLYASSRFSPSTVGSEQRFWWPAVAGVLLAGVAVSATRVWRQKRSRLCASPREQKGGWGSRLIGPLVVVVAAVSLGGVLLRHSVPTWAGPCDVEDCHEVVCGCQELPIGQFAAIFDGRQAVNVRRPARHLGGGSCQHTVFTVPRYTGVAIADCSEPDRGWPYEATAVARNPDTETHPKREFCAKQIKRPNQPGVIIRGKKSSWNEGRGRNRSVVPL